MVKRPAMACDTTFCLLAATCVLLVYYCAVVHSRETERENAGPDPRYPRPHNPPQAPAAYGTNGGCSGPEERPRRRPYMSVGSRVKEHMERRVAAQAAGHLGADSRREALLRTLALDLKADPAMKAISRNAPSGLP